MFKRFKYGAVAGFTPPDRRFSSTTLIVCLTLSAAVIALVIALQTSLSSPFYALIYALTHHDSQSTGPWEDGSGHGLQVGDPVDNPFNQFHDPDWIPDRIKHPGFVNGPTAVVKNGTIIGTHYSIAKQDWFLGVPYAQPPVGELRFRAPQPLNETWFRPWHALDHAKDCWMSPVANDTAGSKTQSENCLYLNIVRPAKQWGKKLPVVVFFHGGWFQNDTAANPKFNLRPTVANSVAIDKPIIAVSVNYRLGGWGMLASDALIASGDTNLALRDQRMALHWIQENIRSFWGDPEKVTIWGSGAGAASVGLHLLAYGGRDDGLFRAAIMQSGSPIPYQAMNGTQYHQSIYDKVASHVGCLSSSQDTLKCITEAPREQLNEAFNSLELSGWFPFKDGDLLQDYPSNLLAQGKFVRVPIITGTNTDEGIRFAPYLVNSDADFLNCIQVPRDVFPGASIGSNLAQRLADAYSDDPCIGAASASLECERLGALFGMQYRRCASYIGDAIMVANRRRTCQIWNEHSLKVYSYRFNALPGAGFLVVRGVEHSSELPFAFDHENMIRDYLFQTPGQTNTEKNDAQDHVRHYLAMAKDMSKAWISFVHDLDPNSYRQNDTLSPLWPAYTKAEPQNFVFDGDVMSYVEDDTYRGAGIMLINDAVTEYQR